MRRHGLGGLGAAKRDGCRDEKGIFVPVPQCTGRKRAKLKPQKRPEKPTKPRVVSKPTRAKKAAPERLLRKPWLRSSPFTKEQTDTYNRYTHFEIDFNKEFDVEIDRIKKQVADTLEKYQTSQGDIDISKSEINKYRRKLYEYYLSRFDLQSYYPPVSVVGPAKYPYQRKSKAAAREKKMITTWQKAVAEFDRAIYRITKGRTAKAVTFQWSELALAMNRLSFGKRYAEQQIKEAQFPNAEAFASTYRKRGRELHKELVRNAVDRGTPIEYIAVKDYPDLLERAQVLHAPPEISPQKIRMEKKKAAAKEKPLTKDERDLLRVIGDRKMHLDDLNELLYKEAGMTRYAVSSALLMLELKRRIQQSAGKMFEATKPPKMPPAPLEAFAFRIEPKEEAIVKRIEKGQKVGKDEVKFSHLLQYAHTYYEPEDIRSKLIADKERKAQMNHGSWAQFKLSKADDKRYGKIALEMLQEPKGVALESILKILEPYLSEDHIMGLLGRLYLAGRITEVSKNRYKRAPGGYTPMQIKNVQKSNFPQYLGYVPIPRERKRGKRLFHMLSKDYGGHPTVLPRKDLAYWTQRSGKSGIKVYALFAYSADHAREQIRQGDAVKVTPKRRTTMKRQRLSPKQLKLFGLSGKISTCAYWIPTNGDYTCGAYAPTCESQSPGACKVPPPDQYKFCATTQKVKSNPKGRYGGKLVTRCKTYRSRCMPDSGCIEDKIFLKPEVFRFDKAEVKDIAASMAKEFNVLQKESGPVLSREILDRGGLKAYRGESSTEEWAEIPLHLKRKEGSITMDEMAGEMGFDDEKAFIEAIEKAYPKGRKTVRRKTWKDFEREAEQVMIDQEQRSEYAYESPVPF